MFIVKPTTKFKKDVKRARRRGYDLDLLTAVINQLAAKKSLPAINCNHPMSGDYAGCWECHIAPDWLLIYEIDEQETFLYLTRTGTHSDLF
ncbi:type II toxin-antitoxin system YafQ family toxin [Desulfovibrio sp. ZJ200]|uniref:type II toxin-antitoxin system YafQ family toxin n=1 Tax=Desulfovibrio sp. ZJ200 TaxID=2709792 RepID=UPI0013EB4317|nr:type II toxin-antitoxin system YafQ family toxin [Desulfovibrio sp. ZJ200]